MILFGSKVPAGITVIILIFVMVMLLSGTTLIRLFRSLWAPVQKAGPATSEHFEERARASEERRIRREEEQAARRGYRQVDIDLGPDPSKAVIVDDLSDEDFALLMQRREQSRKKKTSGGKKAPAREPSNPKTANIYAFQSEDGFDGGTPTTKKRTVKKAADPTKATKAELDAAAAAADAMIAAENAAKEPAPQVRLDDIIKKASQRNAPATETSEATAEPAAKPSTPAAESATASPDTPAAAGEKPPYKLPPLDCLKPPKLNLGGTSEQELRENAEKLVSVLESFGVKTTIVDIERGPSVTRYELSPAPGVKISRITGLADDIALNLAASEVRIEAPIPGKAAVGIEVPNKTRETVTLREILEAPDYQKKAKKSRLTVALGRDIAGNVCMTDIAKMPHLLIAGTTGSGKSVCLNAMILSILYNATPDEVKLVMIDPKQVEFSVYNGIPHLLVPVVSDPHKASGSLAWAVKEMMNRYKTFSENNVRDIKGYNELAAMDPDKPPMPQIVIFIDELADLMMVTPAEVEDSICRLAQLARAAGMHLVVATQRPSVDVITGLADDIALNLA
ncbi:MAG: DNA translocase FtsK, partial [Clostridia bacterium]|nr:DNA translocase FtsK [Clostridia bacterium]